MGFYIGSSPAGTAETGECLQPSLRDFSGVFVYPGLHPGLRSVVPAGLDIVLSFDLTRVSVHRLSSDLGKADCEIADDSVGVSAADRLAG